MTRLDANSSIPIGLAIAMIGGAATWMTTINIQTNANAKSLDMIEQRQIKYNEVIQNIERDIAIVKAKAEIIELRSRGVK